MQVAGELPAGSGPGRCGARTSWYDQNTARWLRIPECMASRTSWKALHSGLVIADRHGEAVRPRQRTNHPHGLDSVPVDEIREQRHLVFAGAVPQRNHGSGEDCDIGRALLLDAD
jgi:hypothetical protein